MNESEQKKGLAFGLLSFFLWGCFPLFFRLYSPKIPALEILIHRIIWSIAVLALVLLLTRKFHQVMQLLKDKRTRNALLLSGTLIGLNWWAFVFAVSSGQILEAGLGQFITPLVSIMLGAILLKERISIMAKVAIFMVFAAVVLQVYLIGHLPIVSIVLGVSFAFYGVVRKGLKVPSFAALFVETFLLAPFCLAYFFYLEMTGISHFGVKFDGFLMIMSGLVTIVPLMIYGLATTRVNLNVLGFMQYLIPTMSVGLGIYFGEELSSGKLISFVLIWIALALVSVDGVKRKKG
ncbi:EamA family transporter RarD [Campylobacter sp. RM12920]|uniref:EamA family transporter RarD n=1 Tax=Campylobacter californiensis TaxID=1032243 RepID=A0ABD4JIV4_9BACT|nr:EamA family transporter RarD [Campylobacter sp. RM12919]MBE2989008.1 EamA family transporter RarD [Campylobacter sp. RM12920]